MYLYSRYIQYNYSRRTVNVHYQRKIMFYQVTICHAKIQADNLILHHDKNRMPAKQTRVLIIKPTVVFRICIVHNKYCEDKNKAHTYGN
jgi:hypothetical protein